MLTPLKNLLAGELTSEIGLASEKIIPLFEVPKDLNHGHLSIPVFFLAKERKKAPPVIAKELVELLSAKKIGFIKNIVAVGGYVNFYIDELQLFTTLYNEVRKSGARLGYSNNGAGKKMVIDYSSPNVAKPMHVGHLRATVIGQAIRNLAETQGYEVVGLNHLGDWGVQFGKLAYAYEKWGSEYPFSTEPFESLFKLYVRFHSEVETNPEIEQEGAQTFKRLEEGDQELVKLWRWFVEISLEHYDKIWKRLGVKHELVRGESFYNDRLRPTEKILEDKGLLVESEGAMVVSLEDEKMPPCLIRKSDGASLYATRDLASAFYRHNELKADLNLYVVGVEQTLHFKQVFSVLRRLGEDWYKNCHHISFGMYRFKDVGKMSSRKGQIIRLEDLLNKAYDGVLKTIEEKNPELSHKETVAEQVAIGAIIFNDLVNDRIRDVDFNWEKALSFDGDSGPYLQYVYVRCASILRKYGKEIPDQLVALESAEERSLMKVLMLYEDTLHQAFVNFKPNILANYLLDVSSAFNKFYQAHRIIGGEEQFVSSRIALVYLTQKVLKAGLGVLNIQCPEAM